jgi:hypothetical protein
MVTQKLFKRRVRERMSKTGERYTTARARLAAKRDQRRAATEPPRPSLDGALELVSNAKMLEATGRGWETWLATLDGWGARDRKRSDTVEFLTVDHGVPGWYAMAITTGFERTRGLRLKHQQPDGYTVYGSKTIGVSSEVALEAFVDERARRQWLTDGTLSLRSAKTSRAAYFDWEGGPTRVTVSFEAKGPNKVTVSVAHERLRDSTEAEAAKAAWKQRLAALKAYMESAAAS